MKRVLTFIIILLFSFSTVGCNRNNDIEVPANFYYAADTISYNNQQGVLRPEIREIANCNGSLEAILNQYLSGPESDGFLTLFPSGVRIQSVTRDDTLIRITLSREFALLSGIDLTLACAGICMTTTELTKCESVQICVQDATLDGAPYIQMAPQDLLFLDDYIEHSES